MVSRKDFTYAEATTGALSCCAVCDMILVPERPRLPWSCAQPTRHEKGHRRVLAL